mgnify:CR=1 FL=1
MLFLTNYKKDLQNNYKDYIHKKRTYSKDKSGIFYTKKFIIYIQGDKNEKDR